jgi:hypothetical protein
MQEEVFVIQTKDEFRKYPIDKRNRFLKDKEIITTMDFLETYHYVDLQIALDDLKDMGLKTNDFEVKKYSITYQEVK